MLTVTARSGTIQGMQLDLERAAEDARRAASECGVPLKIRRALYREIQDNGGVPWDRLDFDGERAVYAGMMVYHGGMGALGVGTMPEDFTVKRAMEAEFTRVYWTEAP